MLICFNDYMRSIIFDFDYTLFNAGAYKKALSKSLEAFGINQKIWQKTYEISKKLNKNNEYIPNTHLEILAEKYNCNLQDLQKAYEKVIKKTNKFFYSDSIATLKKLSKNNKLYLLTFGDVNFQKQKIHASGTEKYFQKIIITNQDKHTLKNIGIPDIKHALFINDNPKEIIELKKNYPDAEFIQIIRRNGKYKKIAEQFTLLRRKSLC